jgi:ATP-binding cassette subfamily F protein 3
METREVLVTALAEYAGAVVLVSHDWHLVELVADRLWLVADGTVRPFDDDLDGYRRRLLEREAPSTGADGASGGGDLRRAGRREAAERRQSLQPLYRASREAEAAAARLAAEQQELDRTLAAPGAFDGRGAALAEALKRRAEIARRLEEAEAEWLAAESAIEATRQRETSR